MLALFSCFWKNRQLILQMTKREVVGRYRGSMMGLIWSFFNPVLMLAVYTFVFSMVFNARWAGGEGQANSALMLFVGMIVHGLFAECVNRAPALILANVSYVKKVVFPLETLPFVAMGSALFHSGVSLVVLLAAQLLLGQGITLSILVFPMILLPLLLATIGVTYFLAATGVYIRDIGQMTGMFTSILMFISPVFYPISALPPSYQFWMKLNPLTYIIEEARKVLLIGELPDFSFWFFHACIGLTLAWAGFWWFQKARKGFADVI
jgi:lipopolysaccharide transport system permease protein